MAKEDVQKERRRYARIKSLYLLSFVEKVGTVQKSAVSMGRTLDISSVGVRVEVYQPVETGTQMEMEIAIKEHIFSIQGNVIYSKETPDGNYIVGIELNEPAQELNGEFM